MLGGGCSIHPTRWLDKVLLWQTIGSSEELCSTGIHICTLWYSVAFQCCHPYIRVAVVELLCCILYILHSLVVYSTWFIRLIHTWIMYWMTIWWDDPHMNCALDDDDLFGVVVYCYHLWTWLFHTWMHHLLVCTFITLIHSILVASEFL